MKLLNCLDCDDIVLLTPAKYKWRACRCGQSKGQYIEDYSAEYVGNARILGIRNDVYEKSLHARDSQLDWTWFEIAEVPGLVRKVPQ